MAFKRKYLRTNFKIVLVGDCGVGKWRIIYKFNDVTWNNDEHFRMTPAYLYRQIELDGKCIDLDMWATKGQTSLKPMTSMYFSGAHGFLLVYDITSEESFLNIESWIDFIKEHTAERMPMLLVGNKCDLDKSKNGRQVLTESALLLAAKYNMDFFETSAVTGLNVDEAFFTLIRTIKSQSEQNEKQKTKEKEQKDTSDSFLKKWILPLIGRPGQAQTVPQEIGQDPYARELYEKALQDGKEKDRSIRVNIVGNYRQGKTSLMRRLIGQSITGVESTNGIDIEKIVCYKDKKGKLIYKKAETVDDQGILQRLVRVALSESEQALHKRHISSESFNGEKLVVTKEDVECENKDENNDRSDTFLQSKSNHGEDSDAVKRFSSNSDVPSNKTKTNDEARNKESQINAKVEMLTPDQKKKFGKDIKHKTISDALKELQTQFDFWDFGGQFIFYATHSVFHSRKAIYVLVFDLSVPLNQVVIDQDFSFEHESKTMAHYIQFWMNSIHSFVGSDDGKEPVVLFVGTHKDKIHGNDETIKLHIRKYFSDIREMFDQTTLLNHIYPQDFAVNNQVPNDQAIHALRDTLINLGDNLSSTIEIPAKWIQLEKSLNERKHLKIIHFRIIEAIDSANEFPLGSEEHIKLLLRYHHLKGTYIYFNEPPISDHVILDPQFLIDAFKSLITSERFCSNDPAVRPLWKALRTEARLEKALIDWQWADNEEGLFRQNKEVLLGFLTHHHIISEATRYDEEKNTSTGLGWYIVPSLLQEATAQHEVEEFLNGRKKTILRFTMKFEHAAAVQLVSHRLTAALLGRWSAAELGTKPLLFQNMCIVRLNSAYAGVTETKHDCIELFLVYLCLYDHDDMSIKYCEVGDAFRRFAESVVKHEFRKLKTEDEHKTNPYTICFRCNHENHGISGSLKVIEKECFDQEKRVPCPDLKTHDINMETAKAEWYTDTPLPDANMKYVLSNKALGQLSQCIGCNWQLLGLELGLSQVQINHINDDNPYSTAMKIYSMLRTWSAKMLSAATMENLVIAMKRCTGVTIDWDEIRNFDEMLR